MLLIVWLGGEFGASCTLQIFVFAWEFNLYLAVRSSTFIGGAMMHDARFMTYSLCYENGKSVTQARDIAW